MTPAERPQFALLMTVLSTAYQKAKEQDEALLEGYWITLRDLPLPQVKAAVEEAMKTCKRMPTAADIRDLVRDQVDAEAVALAKWKSQKRQDDAIVMSVLNDAVRYERGREFVDAELLRVGKELGREFKVDRWLLNQLDPKFSLVRQWPELDVPATAAATATEGQS